MPRFYFHTNNPAEGFVQDDEGMDFSSIHEAKCEAVAYAGRVLCDVAEKFWDDADFELTVTDDNGLILFVMRVVGTEAPAIRAGSRLSRQGAKADAAAGTSSLTARWRSGPASDAGKRS